MALINPETGQKFGDFENPLDANQPAPDIATGEFLQADYLATLKQGAKNKSPLPPSENLVKETPTQPTQPRTILNNQSQVNKAREDLYSQLQTPATMPTQEELRQKELERAQRMIDATNQVYQDELAKITKQGAERMQETKSINVSAGLAGSPFKTTAEGRTQDFTDEQTEARNRERQAEITTIMAQAEGRATDQFDKERAFAQQDRANAINEQGAYLDLLEQQQTSARDRIKTLAQGGYSLDELSEQEYRSLLEESGLSDFEARALQNINNPEAQADYSVQGNQLIGYFIDPVTGKPKISTTEIPGMEGVTEANIQEFDGVPYVIGKDKNGNIIGEVLPGYKKQTDTSSPETEEVDGNLLQFNPETNEWDVKFSAPDAEQKDSNFMSQRLSPTEAEKAGVPLGSTYADAQQKQTQDKIDATSDVMNLIDSIKNDKALGAYVGPISSKLPSFKTFTGQTGDLNDKVDRLRNLMTLENLDMMSGVLSETDIKILQEGGTLINRSQRSENFLEEINRLQTNALREQYRMLGITDATYEEALEQVGSQEELRKIIEESLTEIQKSGSSFNSVGADTNTGSVEGIKDNSKVSTSIGSGVATRIVNGSEYWKPGFDIFLEGGEGADVKTPFEGKVVEVGNIGGWGNTVKIQLADGRFVRLSHLKDINVKKGDTLNAQSVVGGQGHTGKVIGDPGTHVDITMYKSEGGYYTSQEVAAMLNTKLA